jgi:outer membrane protein
VVNSEKIFKSIEAYNAALTELDRMANEYQKQVDEKFDAVEAIYNAYMQRRSQLSAASQQANEENILKKEQEATEFQESIFGTDGTLMKKRIELIQPIQQKVFAKIEEYAKQKGYEMIIDVAQNATMLYYSPKADHTEAIIELLKK